MAKTSYYTVDGEILGERTAGVRRNYGVDALGSVTSTIQGSAIENAYVYKPYGELLQSLGSGKDPRFMWVGAQGYCGASLSFSENYIRARHYSPTTSRWGSKDQSWPHELPYSYVQGEPTTIIDPLGLGGVSKDSGSGAGSASTSSCCCEALPLDIQVSKVADPKWCGASMTANFPLSKLAVSADSTAANRRCQLIWGERTNIDVGQVKQGIAPNEWFDSNIFSNRTQRATEVFNALQDDPEISPCPGNYENRQFDRPGIPMPTGGKIQGSSTSRHGATLFKLCIRIAYISGCTGRVQLWSMFMQVSIKTKGGKATCHHDVWEVTGEAANPYCNLSGKERIKVFQGN